MTLGPGETSPTSLGSDDDGLATKEPGTDHPRAATRLRWLRRVALHPAWLIVAVECALLIRADVRAGLNTDVFWHLAAGNWMLAHHSVIRVDIYSYTVRGRPWLAEEWGFEVLLAWMVRHIGPVSYWLLSGGASVLALLVSTIRWRRQGAGMLWTAALSIPAAFALLLGLAPRPQDLSYLLFALELLLLTLAKTRRGLLALFPLLFLIWCNLHGSFVAGLAILVLEVLVSLANVSKSRLARTRALPETPPDRWRLAVTTPLRLRDALATLVASGLATLINPHGLKLVSYAIGVATASPLGSIEEWQSPDFHDSVIFLAIAIPTLLAALILATGRVQSELVDLLIWLGLLAATLHALRFAPYLGIAFGGVAAPWSSSRLETIRPKMLTVPAAVLLSIALVAGNHLPAAAIQRGAAPVAAVNWLKDRGGRVFSTYAWNDYLILRGIPVYIDGRTDLYFGTNILNTYESVSTLNQPPDPVLRRWRVKWVLWPADNPLSNYLSDDGHWRLVRRFATGEVFEHVGRY